MKHLRCLTFCVITGLLCLVPAVAVAQPASGGTSTTGYTTLATPDGTIWIWGYTLKVPTEVPASVSVTAVAAGGSDWLHNKFVKGDKSPEERERHLNDRSDAVRRLRDLEKELDKTKGPKRRGPIQEVIDELKEKIKGHDKEIGEKWKICPLPRI